MQVKIFTFNPFSENTYVLYDDTKECVIIDPGCMNSAEEKQLVSFIEENKLKPVKLLNTHGHIDHVLGNRFVAEKYNLVLETHQTEEANIISTDSYASMYGMPAPRSPKPGKYLSEGDTVTFGNTKLEVLFTPGHSAGHIVFYNRDKKIIIGGDVLFRESIGRTDLPGGDYNTLIKSIKEKLFVLDEDIKVYPGHGPYTTIGHEKEHNPFLQ